MTHYLTCMPCPHLVVTASHGDIVSLHLQCEPYTSPSSAGKHHSGTLIVSLLAHRHVLVLPLKKSFYNFYFETSKVGKTILAKDDKC